MNVNCWSLLVILYNMKVSLLSIVPIWDRHDKQGFNWSYSTTDPTQGIKGKAAPEKINLREKRWNSYRLFRKAGLAVYLPRLWKRSQRDMPRSVSTKLNELRTKCSEYLSRIYFWEQTTQLVWVLIVVSSLPCLFFCLESFNRRV